MNLRRFALIAAMIVTASALYAPSPALAHARYDSSAPNKGEILAVAPSLVEVTFTQDIQRISGSFEITVTKDRGAGVTAGPSVVNDADRTKLSVPLQSALSDGRYVVTWKNVSDEDGDPAEGAFSFYVNYQPNTVDLANDAQLEQIGAEDIATPVASAMSASATPPVDETPAPTRTAAAETPAADVSPTPVADPSGDNDDNSSLVIIVAIIAAVVLIAIAGGVLLARGRR